uniref:F-box domain-containing protein n=1 Tax=Oryza barthii TaxID=65489 RepID=A0A0D3HK34_9ORYZ
MRSPRSRALERDAGGVAVEHVELIPGMPDDVAVDCLARVQHGSHRAMRRVCRGWRSAAATPAFAMARAEAGANEDLVYLLQFANPAAAAAAAEEAKEDGDAPANSPAYGVAVYNVTTGEWRREKAAPPVPMFAQCAAVGTRLAVLGGWDPETFEPVADVHVLDASTGVWRSAPPMRSARSFFACAEAGGRIYVAGGHDKHKNALKTAEAYDAGAAVMEWLGSRGGWREVGPSPPGLKAGTARAVCVGGGERVVVTGAIEDSDGGSGRHALWVFDVKTKNWTVVRPPPEFAGFAFSVAAVRI